MEIRKVTSADQAMIPDEVREALGLQAGDTLEWEMVDGAARVRKAMPIDWAWHEAISKTLEDEWLSPEDEEAWRDL